MPVLEEPEHVRIARVQWQRMALLDFKAKFESLPKEARTPDAQATYNEAFTQLLNDTIAGL